MTEISFTSKKENKKTKNKEINNPNFWTEEEDKILKEKAAEFNFKNWNSIANFIPGRTSIQCSARYRRIRPGLIKGAWDKEEDNKLLSLYEKYGKNWAAISKEMPHRTGKQIRDRFLNSLDSKFERGKFTEEEDQAIIKYYKIYGNSWAKIAKKLKTRTGDMVKNRFYSSLKKIIFKKNFLKKKRERASTQKNKNKKEEENIFEVNNKVYVIEQDSTVINQEKKESKITKEKIAQKEQNKKKELKEKNENEKKENYVNKEKKQKKEKTNQNEKKEQKEQKEISKFLDIIKDSNEEKDEMNSQKYKSNNNINSTNFVSDDSNNSIADIENKNNNKNISVNTSADLNDHLIKKQLLNNSENENKLVNDNNIDFNMDENIKKNEISNFPDFNEFFRFNSDLFIELKDNVNNFITLSQKDEIDEKLEKLKNFPKVELEYKQNLKEQLDIIYDLENIINQKLNSVQKEIENN